MLFRRALLPLPTLLRSASRAYLARPTATATMTATPPAAGGFPSFSTVNFYAGSKLNRLSWLRTSTDFLNDTITSPDARFLPLKHLDPLVHSEGGQLATLSWDQVKHTVLESVRLCGGDGSRVFGPAVYAIQARDQASKEFTRATDGIGPHNLALVFLGVDETDISKTSLPGELAKRDASAPAGTPYFAISLTYTPPGYEGEPLPTAKLLESLEQSGQYDFIDLRASSAASRWPMHDAAIVAQAKSLLDWNERHQFCPACSRRQYSLWAGYKRGCCSSLGQAVSGAAYVRPFLKAGHSTFDEDGKGECPSTKVLSNFHYPRTDPVIIMAIISADGNKVLLGRQKKWPKKFVSCLAGFCEPGESFEEAVRREVLEEAGVKVNQVIYHSSQPWPYPTNLMAGFFGIADENASIRLDLDNELEEARFYSREEILSVLDHSAHFTRSELANIDDKVKADLEREGKKLQEAKVEPPSIRLPPETAIARVLVAAWARGDAVLPQHVTQRTKM